MPNDFKVFLRRRILRFGFVLHNSDTFLILRYIQITQYILWFCNPTVRVYLMYYLLDTMTIEKVLMIAININMVLQVLVKIYGMNGWSRKLLEPNRDQQNKSLLAKVAFIVCLFACEKKPNNLLIIWASDKWTEKYWIWFQLCIILQHHRISSQSVGALWLSTL